jgi:hypothetical protein
MKVGKKLEKSRDAVPLMLLAHLFELVVEESEFPLLIASLDKPIRSVMSS